MLLLCISKASSFNLEGVDVVQVFNRVFTTSNGIKIAAYDDELKENIMYLLKTFGNSTSLQDMRINTPDEKFLEMVLLACVGNFAVSSRSNAVSNIQYDVASRMFTLQTSSTETKFNYLKIFTIIIVVIAARLWHINTVLTETKYKNPMQF